jgi:hypothetical protein
MIILQENQICPHASKCPHADGCYGTKNNRNNKFTCEFVDTNGNVDTGGVRNPLDKTGKMKVILEGAKMGSMLGTNAAI